MLGSLRGRLTLGVVVVLAAVLGVAGVIVSRYVNHTERSTLDDRLRRTAELSLPTAVAAVENQLPADDRRLDAVLRATGSGLRLLLGRTVLLDTGRPRPTPRRLPYGLQTVTGTDGRHYRVYVTSLRDPGLHGLGRLEVSSSLTGVEHRQRALNRRLALLGALALLVAGAGTWLGAARMLAPLRRLREGAGRIASEEDLGQHELPADEGSSEVRGLAASFNAMLGRLGRSAAARERALTATRRFAADAGHELRTPLTSVQATLSALHRHPEVAEEQRTAMLGDALDQQRRMVALLDGLQALARGDAPPAEAQDLDLLDIVGDAAAAARARHPGVTWDVRLPERSVCVRGWEPGLRLLVDNLLENAARHGARDGAGRVRVGVEDGPVLVVADDGPGVPEADRERIFAPFERIAAQAGPGSGLGLALVAQQAEHHGARVSVGDAPGGGAEFRVRFA